METGNIIGLFGAAVVVIFGLLPFAPFRVSPRVVYGGLIFGFALLGICAVEMWQKISPGLSVTANGATIATISAWPSALAFGAIFASIMWVSTRLLQIPGTQEWQSRESEGISWPNPSSHDLLSIYEDTKRLTATGSPPKIKILATEKGRKLADALVEFFSLCKWELEINHDGGSYIFPVAQPFKGVRLKHRETYNPYGHASGWIFNAISVFTGNVADQEHFPDTDAFNFFQIEIGDGPRRDW
jgi:hypothetical protein